MDWCRWFNKTNINLLLRFITGLLMMAYLYIKIDNYMQYKTKTLVSKLNPSDMPEIEWFLCGKLEALYKGSELDRSKIKYKLDNTHDYDQIIIGLFWNGTKINDHGQPFIRDTDKCWQVDGIPSLGDLSFTLRTRTGIEWNFYLMKEIKGRGRHIGPFLIYPFHNGTKFTRFETIIYSTRMKYPYDTNCVEYNVTKRHCFLSCRKMAYDVEICEDQCSQQDCRILETRYHIEYRYRGQDNSADFSGKENYLVQSQPFETLRDIILFVIGVIGFFVGVSIYDIVHQAIDFVCRRYQQYHPQTEINQGKIINIARGICIFVGLFCVSINIYRYANRKAATDAYLGPAVYDMDMIIRLCYDHNISVGNRSFDQLDSITGKFEDLFKIGAENFEYLNSGFIDDKKCFFGRTKFREKFKAMVIISIEASTIGHFYFASSIDGTFPGGKDQIRVEDTVFATADTHYFSAHPSFTKCSTYPNHKGSKENCYDHCIKDDFSKLFGSFPIEIMIINGSNMTFSNQSVPYHVKEKCSQECSLPPCVSNVIRLRKSGMTIQSKKPKLSITREGSMKSITEHDSQTIGEHLAYNGILLSTFSGFSIRTFAVWLGMKKSKACALSGIGMSLHMAYVTWVYFTFKVQTGVKVGFADVSNIPCATIFMSKNPNIVNHLCPTLVSDNFTYLPSIIERVSIAKSSKYDYEHFDGQRLNDNSIQYLNGDYRAHSINVDRMQSSWSSFYAVPEEISFKIHFSPEFRKCMMMNKTDIIPSISLHECGSVPDPASAGQFDPIMRDFAYNIDVARRLSKPYGERCDTSKEKRIVDWNECIIDGSDGYKSTSPLKTLSGQSLWKNCIADPDLVKPCETTFYSLIQIDRPDPGLNHHVSFNGPVQETRTEYFPIMDFLTLSSLLIDIFGLWWGGSLFTFLDYILDHWPESWKLNCSHCTSNNAVVPSAESNTVGSTRVFGYGSLRAEPGMMFVVRSRRSNNNASADESVIAVDIE